MRCRLKYYLKKQKYSKRVLKLKGQRKDEVRLEVDPNPFRQDRPHSVQQNTLLRLPDDLELEYLVQGDSFPKFYFKNISL